MLALINFNFNLLMLIAEAAPLVRAGIASDLPIIYIRSVDFFPINDSFVDIIAILNAILICVL